MIKKIEKYGANWCAPCKLVDKTLAQLPSEIEIIKIDIEENEDLAKEKNIRSIPVLIFYNEHNEEVFRFVGAISYEKIKEFI